MATGTQITPEQYLGMHFPGREPEYVRGEIVERPFPTFPHGDMQLELGSRLRTLERSYPVRTGVEVRVEIAPDLFRIPDIALWRGEESPGRVPDRPPLLIVEILSPDDKHFELLEKLEEYRNWGVEHIWLIEPELKKLRVYEAGTLRPVEKLDLPELNFSAHAAELFRER